MPHSTITRFPHLQENPELNTAYFTSLRSYYSIEAIQVISVASHHTVHSSPMPA